MDEKHTREFLTTKAAIRDGYDSGVSLRIRTVDEIMEAAIYRQKAESKGNNHE